jgi:DNA-binding protein HU-beta
MTKLIQYYVNELATDETFNRFSKVCIKALLEQLFAQIKRDVSTGNDVRINSFGTFKLTTRAARPERKGRNPSTGEPLTIAAQPEKQVITFKQSKVSK